MQEENKLRLETRMQVNRQRWSKISADYLKSILFKKGKNDDKKSFPEFRG
jgi:hypothetical protein